MFYTLLELLFLSMPLVTNDLPPNKYIFTLSSTHATYTDNNISNVRTLYTDIIIIIRTIEISIEGKISQRSPIVCGPLTRVAP